MKARAATLALTLISLLTLTSCGTVLRPLDADETAKRLPEIKNGTRREALFTSELCRHSLRYQDETRRILVYGLDFEHRRPVCDRWGPYELVLIFDRDDHLERFRLLRVK